MALALDILHLSTAQGIEVIRSARIGAGSDHALERFHARGTLFLSQGPALLLQ